MDDEIRRIREKRIREMMEAAKRRERPGVVHVDANNFAIMLSEHRRLVIDFWAEWCGPCRMVAPVVEELAAEFAGRIAFGKCNTDENPAIASQFGISAIPTLLFFMNGKLADRVIGAYPKDVLRARIVRTFGSEG